MTREERIAHIRVRYENGATLAAIGEALGISRERVRQIALQFNMQRSEFWTLDRVLDVCRWARTMAMARGMIGRSHWPAARELLVAAQKWDAVQRLWRIRARRRFRQSVGMYGRAQLIALLRREAERIGHTPGIKDMNARDSMTPCHSCYVQNFGSIAAAQAAAGLTPRRRGGAGHLYKIQNLSPAE